MAGFMTGNASMTICIFDQKEPLDLEKLRKGAFSKAIDPDGHRFGFVGMGDLLDTDNFFLAASDPRYSGFSFRLDSRKPPKAVINLQLAEKIREEEASGHPVGSRRKKELREAITETLISQSEFVPMLTDCIWDAEKGRLFIAATGDALVERVLAAFQNVFGLTGHMLEADKDMESVFSAVQRDNGLRCLNYHVQPLGSASLASTVDAGEKSAIAVVNNTDAVAEALGQGMAINKISLVAVRDDSDNELQFSLGSDLKVSRLRLPKAEKGAEEDATFLINAEICGEIADIVEAMASESGQN